MSVGTLRYHLKQAGDIVVTLVPLCIELPATNAAPLRREHHVTTRSHSSEPELHANSSAAQQRASHDPELAADPKGPTSTAIAELLRCAAELQTMAATMLTTVAALLAAQPVTGLLAQNARGHGDTFARTARVFSK